MRNHWDGLASSVQKFKAAVKDELEKHNQDFHNVINGEEPLKFYGLAPRNDERNEYLVDPSDVLFWHDPTAYIDELERWKEQQVNDKFAEIKQFLSESGQSNIFTRLVESLRRKRVAPFVGAGFSVANGYPLWRNALDEIVKKLEDISKSETRALQEPLLFLKDVKSALQAYDYIKAAQIVYENQKVQFERFIMDRFDGVNNKIIKGPILKLTEISEGCIITTNFDGLIEKVFQDSNKPIEGYMHGTQTQNQFASKLIQGDRCILKLHGHFNSPNTYVFSQTQYDDAYGLGTLDYSKPLAKTLRQIFISHSLLFLGCSLEKDRTLDLFKDVYSSKTFEIPEHFAFLPMPDNGRIEKENSLAAANIHPIWYNILKNEDKSEDHSVLEQLLDFAISCSKGKARIEL